MNVGQHLFILTANAVGYRCITTLRKTDCLVSLVLHYSNQFIVRETYPRHS
jgi:hypothetical protein